MKKEIKSKAALLLRKLGGEVPESFYRGEKGERGERGIDGRDGKDGKDGINGKDGSEGKGGKDGSSIKLEEVVDELRPEVLRRFPYYGGGNANRNIAVAGNTSVLSRYTDINLKPGSGVAFIYSNNDATKYFDLTISTDGAGGGITRQINTLSVSSTIAAIADTDRVFLCNEGVQVVLPTAVGDDNLYTIKNTSTSSVLVATTGGQTIDGDANQILGTQFTAIDVVSNGANWLLT